MTGKSPVNFAFRRLPAAAAALILLTAVWTFLPGDTAKATRTESAFRTTSRNPEYPNYDIRLDKNASTRHHAYRTAVGIDEEWIRERKVLRAAGEARLRRSVPGLRIEYTPELGTAEIIASGRPLGREFLTAATTGSRSAALRTFVRENADLLGIASHTADSLKVAADYTNPDGNLSFVELIQEIDGVPVFRGEIKAGFTRRREIVRVVNNLAPVSDRAFVPSDFGNPASAVAAAFSHTEIALTQELAGEAASENAVKFGGGDSATVAERIYFPLDYDVLLPAWRIAIWGDLNAYYVIVDARSGTLLWRKNVTEDQTQPSSYGVYANPNAMINVADNPFALTPGPAAPNGQQGAALPRTVITRIGNEPPYQFNNLGWIADGVTRTDGNAVQAGLDRDGTDGVDADSEAVSSSRNFVYSYNPFNPNTNTGDEPVPSPQTYPGSSYQQGSVTQLFYVTNWFHDELYRLGFTEQARNFQHDNFGRGGLGSDRVRAEGQDSLGTNNANFSTFADGIRPRMQMYLWANPNPDIDGNLDADVVIHEYTHGLSNRLHGNASGLTTNMSRGLGEGWSDFYGHAMLSEPADAINGIYTTGSYDTYLGIFGYTNNYYYGIRRFPKAVMASLGPNGRPHNPLTFADADQSQLNLSDGAFPRGPYGSDTADAVHNLGEIWSSALWEVRARFINRLGWNAGNRKILQLVTDGMKLAPLAPTFITERDAIIAAAKASSSPADAAADVADIWAGFAIRGIGASAVIHAAGTGLGDARVTESFALPNLSQELPITFTDAGGNGNGFPDPGETVLINIPLTNGTGVAATGVSLALNGGVPADYGTISGVDVATRAIPFQVPASAPCGGLINITLAVNSSLGPVTFMRSFAVGAPVVTAAESFDTVAAPALPQLWSVNTVSGGIPFVTRATNAASAPNAVYAANPAAVGGGTALSSPAFNITASGAVLRFSHSFETEAAWDGGILEMSIDGGPFQDILAAGGIFLENPYNSVLGNGANNPFSLRQAWSGTSNGYRQTSVRLPASAAGRQVRFRWLFGADDNTAPAGGGWNIDDVRIIGSYACAAAASKRADFDGDGRTDLSVYRPSERNWYIDRSTAGFTAVTFGLASDHPAASDFDGDGKTDIAVYRPSEGNWYIINSSNSSFTIVRFGIAEDIAQPGDFDGDGKDDVAVWRPSSGVWYWSRSSDGVSPAVRFGLGSDLAAANDYDGDGRDDMAVWRPADGVWHFLLSGTGYQYTASRFGLNGDRPVPADYDGDGKCDIAVYRPSDGIWYILGSHSGGFSATRWGLSADLPVPGDYDGDGRDDIAVYRSGIWYLNKSSGAAAAVSFGIAGDAPIPSSYIP